MSTDRELLEGAAKAAGLRVWWGQGWQSDILFCAASGSDETVTGYEWNPLKSDGDAFRLAVELKMDVFVRHEWAEAVGPMGAPQKVWYGADADPAAATRRAVVSAAAALART